MKHHLFPILLYLGIFLSCQSDTTPADSGREPTVENTPESNYILEPGRKIGMLSADKCTRPDVLAAYGADAVVDSIYLGEGFMDEGVVLFPNEPHKRVDFYWDMEIDSLRPSFIRISGDENGHTAWKTPEGISIGTSIEEVEKLNGKPFMIYGFGWDYGGVVNSWNGGKLPETLGLTFSPTTAEIPEYLLGEVKLASNDKSLLSVKPVVSVMVSSFRE